MSAKNSITAADYLPWDTMLTLVRRLYRDGDYRMSLIVGCGAFFGLRISDILTLNWKMLLERDRFIITEKKTGKRRIIKINPSFARLFLSYDKPIPLQQHLPAEGKYI